MADQVVSFENPKPSSANNKPDSQGNSSSSKVQQDDSEKKKKNRYRGKGKKKAPNDQTNAEASTSNPPQANENKPVNKKTNKKKPKPAENKNTGTPSALITKNRAQGRLTDAQDVTESNSASTSSKSQKKKNNYNRSRANHLSKLPPGNHDMATLLAHELKTSTYECMICMEVIKPANHVWTCDCCWAIFHLDCVHTWASRSLTDTSTNKMITGWRCPGCQNSRTVIPKDYFCFCGKQRNPEASRYHTPHSCDQLCKRHKACPHKCVLPCHPGPCPPCGLMGPVLTCYCGQATSQSRCTDTDYSTKGFSCKDDCDEVLGCGKHRCESECHSGVCPPCELQEVQACYCGRHERTARCGSGRQIQLRGHIGYYSCSDKCNTVFACGQHHCQRSCHPCTANSQVCPFDPSKISSCPCGTHTVTDLLKGKNRASCADPIPTCESTCNKIGACGHPCTSKCHLGECPPCQETVQVACRCQSTSFEDICFKVCKESGGEPPLCTRVCKSVRNCGRHQCGIKCCPAMKVNGKRKVGTEFLHDCPLKCDQLLSCGNHRCQDMCHRGKCLPCLEATFDDVTCNCGRTRLEPPVRCGTKLPSCPHPCLRPNPCGHIRFLNHNCHPDSESCPPCPALVTRHCLCGKTELKNVPCYRESPRCGRSCEKQLPCGKHICLKACHSGPCLSENESCTKVCGGARESCGHPCQQKCHDGPCPETRPCTTRFKATCKCGQNTAEIVCNASFESSGSKKELDCNDFCAKVLRNRRLAAALDIKRDEYAPPSSPALSTLSNPDSKPLTADDLGYYDDTIREFYNDNSAWCRHMENTLIEFARNIEKKTFHFKPMRREYRRFIHRYAIHFNISTEAIDAEPKRSIILRKSLGVCRIPPILLSKAARNPSLNRPPPSLQTEESSVRSPLKQPINALYLTDMTFGLTKIELDAELMVLMKLGDDSIHFTSKWVNENDAIVVPSISDSISMDEKEAVVWQLKKIVKAAFVNEMNGKAARVDCCWVNQKGEVTWNEKDLSQPKKVETVPTNTTTRSVNAFDALNSVDDDGWTTVGGNNPFKLTKDSWFDSVKPSTPVSNSSANIDSQSTEQVVETKELKDTNVDDQNLIVNNEPLAESSEIKETEPVSDNWEDLLDEN